MNKTLRRIVSLAMSVAMLALLPVYSDGTKADAAANPSGVRRNLMVGYYHVFKNGAGNGLQLRDVDPCWDVIELSFGEPTGSDGTIGFSPMTDSLYANEADFLEDVKYVQARGQKVCLSIGGQNGQVSLNTAAMADNFADSICAIIDKYGLNGFDIDFEGHSFSLISGDTSLKNPISPTVVNTISAVKKICARYGNDFLLTMAPETLLCQNGCAFYGGSGDSRNGVYLPLIDACREELSWLQVQYYNTANGYSPYVSDSSMSFSAGTVWYNVVMMDLMMEGFYIGQIYTPSNIGDPDKYFEGLRPDQMAMGVPSGTGSAGSCILGADNYITALNYMMNGGTIDGYTVRNYGKDFRGIMTWSINWDVFQGKDFSTKLSSFLTDANKAFSLSVQSSAGSELSSGTTATFTASASGNNLGSVSYEFSVLKDGSNYYTQAASSSNTFDYKFVQPGKYQISVTATAAAGTETALSEEITVSVVDAAIASVTANKTKASTGEAITWSAEAVGSGTLTYKFDIYKDSVLYSEGTASTSSSRTFTATQAGEYKVVVTVSDELGSSATSRGGLLWISSSSEKLNISSVKSSVSSGTVTLDISSSGGTGTHLYSCYFIKDGKVTCASSYSADSTVSCKLSSGTYSMRVYVKDDTCTRAVYTGTVIV